jgi:hypothetical protein
MSQPSSDPEAHFAALVEEFLSNPDVTPPEGPASKQRFGSSGLRIHGRIFAMLAHGRLVVKLPKPRVDALVAAGEGERFDAGKGRPMKEWLSLDPASSQKWLALAREALTFVAAAR